MSDSLYDSFIADYYDESPIVKGRLQDVAFYRALTPEERRLQHHKEQRRFLAYQLRRLRGRLDGTVPETDRAGPRPV